MQLNVPPETDSAPYTEIAAALRSIAHDLEKLGPGQPAPGYCRLDIQPSAGDTDDETIARVDAVATVLFGRPAATRELSGGTHHHAASDHRGLVGISVYKRVSNPVERSELELLRAELAALRGYGREVDNGDPSAKIPSGVAGSAMTGRGADGGCE